MAYEIKKTKRKTQSKTQKMDQQSCLSRLELDPESFDLLKESPEKKFGKPSCNRTEDRDYLKPENHVLFCFSYLLKNGTRTCSL